MSDLHHHPQLLLSLLLLFPEHQQYFATEFNFKLIKRNKRVQEHPRTDAGNDMQKLFQRPAHNAFKWSCLTSGGSGFLPLPTKSCPAKDRDIPEFSGNGINLDVPKTRTYSIETDQVRSGPCQSSVNMHRVFDSPVEPNHSH